MPTSVNWSKYGLKDEDKKTTSTNLTRVDWSKYQQPKKPSISPEIAASSPAIQTLGKPDELVSRALEGVQQSAAEWKAQQPEQPKKTTAQKVADVALFAPRLVKRFSEQLAIMATPDAPMIGVREDGTYGALEGPTARDLQREMSNTSTGVKWADKTADVAGNIGSYFLNPAAPAAGPLAVYRAVQNVPATQTAQKLIGRIQSPTGQRVAQEALREGTAAAAYAPFHSLAQGDTTLPEIARNVAIEGALGAAAGGVVGAISEPVQKIVQKWLNKKSEKVLALPEPRPRGNPNTAVTDEVIVPEYTFKLPEPSKETVERIEGVRQAWDDLAMIEDELRKLESSYQKAIIDEYQFLKQSRDNRMGVQQGGLIRDQHGDVVGRYGRISMNPEWYQRFYRENNRVPTNRDLWELAKKRVDEGYFEEGVEVPPWKVQNNYDETVRALTETRDLIKADLQKVGLGITDAKLKDQAFKSLRRNIDQAAEPVEEVLQTAPPRIRDRVYNFLDEAEQAAWKRIESRRNRLSANPVDEYMDYAIIMAAKLGKGTIKAADFAEELVKEFGEHLRPHADRIYRMAQEHLRKSALAATRAARSAMEFNSGGGDATTFRQKVVRDVKKDKKSFAERYEEIRSQFVDDLAALEGLERRIRGRLASAENSLYKTARLYKGAPAKAHNIVETRFAPIVRMVEQAGFTMDDLGDYALAMHARDVNNSYMKSGFTDAEINDVIRKYGTPEMEAARQELVKINDDMLQELVAADVISNDLAETLRVRWPNYMPLFRHFDDNAVEFESGLSNALANVANPIKKLKGSEREVIEPLENMVKNIFRTVNAAERNRVAVQLARLAEEPGAENFIRRLEPDEKVERKNVVTVKINGENVKYEVEPEVYKAMLNLDKESNNMFIRILSKPASVLRAGATLTPEFSLRNPMRDIVQAFIVSKSGFNPLIDFPIGLIEAIKGRKGNSKLYNQWMQDLGAYGNIISMDRNLHREALEKVFKQPQSKKFVNIVSGRSLLGLLRAISDTTESATKLGEYRAALRSGATRAEAAYRSRDIMDFARAGSGVRSANKIIAFLNANIQGKSKLIRAAKENPVGVLTRAFVSVTLPTVGAFILQKYFANAEQQRTIEEAPDWMKDTFWLIPVPGTDTVARIPKPFDVAPIFSNLPERALQYVYNTDKDAFDGFVRRSLSDMSLPMQISGIWPIVEGMANYSFFRDAPIVPMREQNLEKRDQYDPMRTTETARVLARGVEAITGGEGPLGKFASPRIMDYTIRGFTAGLGTYATSAIDSILQGLNLSDKPKAPAKRIEQQPLLRAFTVDSLSGGKTLDKFYERKEKLTTARNSARLNERPFDKEQEYQLFNQAGNLISEINAGIRAIELDRTLTPQQKRQAIDKLQKARLELARRVMQVAERTAN